MKALYQSAVLNGVHENIRTRKGPSDFMEWIEDIAIASRVIYSPFWSIPNQNKRKVFIVSDSTLHVASQRENKSQSMVGELKNCMTSMFSSVTVEAIPGGRQTTSTGR